jgi:hypothetical protein
VFSPPGGTFAVAGSELLGSLLVAGAEVLGSEDGEPPVDVPQAASRRTAHPIAETRIDLVISCLRLLGLPSTKRVCASSLVG